MTRKKKIETIQNNSKKSSQSQGLVILGRTTYIDEIIRKAESQASIGPRTISIQNPITLPQAVASPSVAHAKIHGEIEGVERSLQTVDHIGIDPSREGGSCNLQEGEGETSGIIQIEAPEPKSPERMVETKVLRIPDQGSIVKPPPHSPPKPPQDHSSRTRNP